MAREALERRSYWRIKRALDAAAAACLIIVLAPLMALVGFLVMCDVGLPLLFWQSRPGSCGRPFRLYKFRTMAAAHNSRGERVPDEQRLSCIGQFLRRTRLDELPQLYNILTGDMSLVGPRPLLPADQSPTHAARLLVRPGLTGWAQVKGGREISAEDKAVLDVWYVRNASFRLDMEILFRTIPFVLFGERNNPEAIQQAKDELTHNGSCEVQAPIVELIERRKHMTTIERDA
jgi:lipopolysaccharide/colanic/teichoic acid biosynthesis glycosyltransferase